MTKRPPLHWRNLIQSGVTDPNQLLEAIGHEGTAVDVFSIVKRMGIGLFYLPEKLEKFDGMLRVRDGEPEILVNRKHHIHRQRFTAAHELGHLLLHSKELLDSDSDTKVLYRDTASISQGAIKTEIEREADRFSARLLIPDNEIEFYALHYDLEKLAALFQTSPMAMSIRLKGLYGI